MNDYKTLTVGLLLTAAFLLTACGGGGGGGGDNSNNAAAKDTTPDAFTFIDQSGVALSTLTVSNAIVVTGTNAATTISITGGEYSIDGGAFTTIAGTVNDGQSITVRQTSAGGFSSTVDVTMTIGGVSDVFSITTIALDTTPDAFSFTDLANVGRGMLFTSNAVNVNGINSAATISISGGEYSVNGGAFTGIAGNVNNGDSVTVRQSSSANFSTTTDATLTVGGTSDTYSVTTLAADTTPDAFTFTDQVDVAANTLIASNAITVAGINTAAAISIVGGEYSIDGGAYTNSGGTIDSGQNVTVRQTSSSAFSTSTNATLTIGGVSDSFTLTTIAADSTPDAFIFADQTEVATNTLISSGSITVNGINTSAAISIVDGEYSIDGGAFTSTAGTVDNGQTVVVRQTSSANLSTTTDSILTIGGVSDTFSVTTASLNLSVTGAIKQLQFSWDSVAGATFYRLYENPDGVSGFTQVGGDLVTTSSNIDIAVHFHDWANALYMVEACNPGGCAASNQISTTSVMLDSIGYFKASNPDNGDRFGWSTAISGDGNTLAVSAVYEASNATGINGDETDNSIFLSGAVYVFFYDGSNWSQQAYVKVSDAGSDNFGISIAMSDDGDTLAVGAPNDDSNANGINGNNNDFSSNSGAVYVFTRSGSSWSQQAYIKASTAINNGSLGGRLALSGDGNTLASSSNNRAYVFSRSGSTWAEQDDFGPANLDSNDLGITAMALSDNGNTLALGYMREDGGVAGINGDETDNSATDSGATFVFTRSGSTWTQQAYIKASNPDGDSSPLSGEDFGRALALSDDGNTLAIGAPGEDSTATGINGNEADNNGQENGAVYVFLRSGSNWAQQAYVKSSNNNNRDFFGASVALNDDGSILAIGAAYSVAVPGNDGEDSNATGIGGNQTDNSATDAGAVYLLNRSGSTWTQQVYVKASNTDASDIFGYSVSLSDDGNSLAVGAIGERSTASGIDGDQTINTTAVVGATYVY